MKLQRLFETTDWTEQSLSAAVGIDQSTVNRLRRNQRLAGLGLSLRIEQATGGAVRAEDLPMSPKARRDLRAMRAMNAEPSRSAAGSAA